MSYCHVISNVTSSQPKRTATFERRKLTLATLARRRGIDPRREAVICQRNGRWVSQKQWRRVTAKRNDIVTFVVLPRGGDTWRTVAAVAVVIVAAIAAPYIAGPVAGFLGLGAAATAGLTAATTAALAIGGNLLINALIPLPTPSAAGVGGSVAVADSEAPTYAFSVSSQHNVARLGAPIPKWYGYHRVIPDLAATAWWEWVNGFQFLYQVFCLTQGEVRIDGSAEGVFLGRTPIGTFEDIQIQLVPPGGTVSLFEPEVYQAPDVRSIALNAPNDLPVGDDGIYGPFAITPPGVTAQNIGIDISLPRGGYLMNTDGSLSSQVFNWRVEVQEIDDAGAGIGSWIVVANETFNSVEGATNTSSGGTFMGGGYATANKKSTPLTLSYRYTLASSKRWQMRVRRTDNKDLSARAGHDLAWTGLRAFLGGGSYGDVTILAVKIRATASVNDQNIRQVAVVGTGKVPVWNGTAWSAPQATRSIAAVAADIIKNAIYGGARADRDFDLVHLTTLSSTWESRGDYFDFYAAQPMTLWEALSAALRAGRATPFHQAGIVRFHRDAAQTFPRQSFSRENIVKGSFRLEFAMPSSESEIDGIDLRYYDNRVWNFANIRKRRDGLPGDPISPSTVTLLGVTARAHAEREADYLQAVDKYRRIFARFDTELEGLIASRGDLVLLQHDMPRWGLSGRIFSWDADEKRIELWSPPIWADRGAGNWFVYFRDAKGEPSLPVAIESVESDRVIVLDEVPTYSGGAPFDFTASEAEPIHITFGLASDAPVKAIFLDATPRENGRVVSVKCVLEDDRVHVN